ncbi:MAG: DUF11 domain-containing protein, partial [Okeania sp. SIO2D1]|nr:DUF11 domain-containing protein [Okeania sp. SIO2D1]
IFEYTITYRNNTNQPITDFQLTDPLDPNLTFIPDSLTFTNNGIPGITVTGNDNFDGTSDPNLVNPGDIPIGGQITLTFRVKVNNDPGSPIVNTITGTSDGNPPAITEAVINLSGGVTGPNLVLVKRITNVTRNGATIGGVDFSRFIDESNTQDDNALSQAGLTPVGVFQLGSDVPTQSGDEIEYTVYFLANGTEAVNNARICDSIPTGTTYVNGSLSLVPPPLNSGSTVLTDGAGDDVGTFISPLNLSSPFQVPPCASGNPNGSVLFDLGPSLSNVAPNNLGLVRFRVKVD